MKTAKFAVAMLFAPIGAGLLALTGCGSAPNTPVEEKQLVNDSMATLKDLEIMDPSLTDKINACAGYAVFPNVGKGGLGLEVASGNGDVYQMGNKYIGTSHLGMVGGGFDLGGQSYSEVILFETPAALQEFEDNKISFDATASAVALKAGATANAKYEKGLLRIYHVNGGAMIEAGIGGQQFTFKAANPMPATMPMP